MNEIQTEFDAAVATARHALEQFNNEPLVDSKREGQGSHRGSVSGATPQRLLSVGTGSCARNRKRASRTPSTAF
jgi:hypothetical protein